jgi:ribosomal protein S18 acetylase RimI-like enzyme
MTERRYNKSPEEISPDITDGQEGHEFYHDKFQKRIMGYLENNGIVSHGSQGEIICDINKIQTISKKEMRPLMVTGQKAGEFNWQTELMRIFQDKDVYSAEDYQKLLEGEKVDSKPLFYTPTKEQAFDIDSIKESDFYLAPSEINGQWNTLNKYYQEQLNYNGEEADVALHIYHPRYGNGDRNEDGVIVVKKNPDADKYIAINSEWLQDNLPKKSISRDNPRHNAGSWEEPKKTLSREEFENLSSSGLLTSDDFSHYEKTDTGKIFRTEVNIGKKGQVRANTIYQSGDEKKSINCGYILGAEFEGKKLVKLEDNFYGIVSETEGEKQITDIFHPADYETIQARYDKFEKEKGRKPQSANITIGKKDPDFPGIKKFQETDFMQPRRSGESDIDYANRIAESNAVRNYNLLEKLSSRLSQEAQIGLHNLPLEEQNCLASFAFKNGDKTLDGLVQFVKQYGYSGIRTFSSCEYGTEMGNRIMEIGKAVNPEIAKKIFSKYNEVAELAHQSSQELADSLTKEKLTNQDKSKITEHLLRKGKDLLSDFYLWIQKNSNPDKLLDRLEQIKTDIMLFAATFKSLAEKGEVGLAEIKGAKLETKPARELSPTEQGEMMKIFLENRTSGSSGKQTTEATKTSDYSKERLSAWTKKFEEAMESDIATFYILRFADKIVSFMRSEPREDNRIYVGSFNVKPEARSSEIGTAMMREIIDELAKTHIVSSVINVKKTAWLNFCREKFKFRIKKIEENYKNSQETYYYMERNDHVATKEALELAA